jgi:hypothetical protein
MAVPIIERFMKFVSPEPNSGCWLWLASTDGGGYGQFQIGRWRAQKMVRAHRLSYELHVGPIPRGLHIDHLCRVRSCVNPKHLEPVTKRENERRGLGGKNGGMATAAIQRAKTHCPYGHEYTPANTIGGRRGRACRECKNSRRRVNQRALPTASKICP